MSTTAVAPTTYTGTNNTNAAGNAVSTKGSDLDENSFLQLLVAQLKNQDPLNPMSNTDFIAQTAQFSSLQQMTSLNTTVTSQGALSQVSAGATLIGKKITSSQTDDAGNAISGTVSSVTVTNGVVNLDINGTAVPLSSVTQIQSATTSTGTGTGTFGGR